MQRGLPEEFKHLLKYACALKFSEWPDYGYLHGLFSNLCQEVGESQEGLASLTPSFSKDFVNLKLTASKE